MFVFLSNIFYQMSDEGSQADNHSDRIIWLGANEWIFDVWESTFLGNTHERVRPFPWLQCLDTLALSRLFPFSSTLFSNNKWCFGKRSFKRFCKWNISCEIDFFRIPVGLLPPLAGFCSIQREFLPGGGGGSEKNILLWKILMVDTKVSF